MELKLESYMVSTKRPVKFTDEQFRTDAKCADGMIILAGWELKSRRWFSVRVLPSDALYLFKNGVQSQWASTSAELLASVVALIAFDWLKGDKQRKSLQISLCAGTDNRANESLSEKRATTKWPLMAINMQMSALLAKARLSLALRWRPREENTEADDLTNEKFGDFLSSHRVQFEFADLQLDVLQALVKTDAGFEEAKRLAKDVKQNDHGSKSKKFDKSPW